jgi:hypothetical protein
VLLASAARKHIRDHNGGLVVLLDDRFEEVGRLGIVKDPQEW